MFECASECIRLTLFELQGKYISHVRCINNIKKGLFTGSLFSRDKCGLNAAVSNVRRGEKKKVDFLMFVPDPEIIHARAVMYFMAPADERLLAGYCFVVCRPSCKRNRLA